MLEIQQGAGAAEIMVPASSEPYYDLNLRDCRRLSKKGFERLHIWDAVYTCLRGRAPIAARYRSIA